MQRILATLNNRPWTILIATFLFCAAAVTQLVDLETGRPRLLLDSSVDSLLPHDDPAREFYDEVKRLFGTDDTIMVVLADDDVFSPENLERVKRLTKRFEEIESVERVSSLATALSIKSENDELNIPDLHGQPRLERWRRDRNHRLPNGDDRPRTPR
jgi:predicted RND superfamily exporter protein